MKKVLVVEDDHDIAKAISLRLTSANYEVHLAHDVPMGVSAAVKTVPDAVLLDITMPGGDGILLAERLKAIPELSHTPVIFMTASMLPEYREKAAELGAAGFFEKPFDSVKLLELVDQVIDSRQ